jgi:hypothetical protein
MRKAKLYIRSQKPADSFFSVEKFDKHGALSSANNSSDKHNFVAKFLKQVFIFLPGTFLLFLADRMIDDPTYLIFLLPLALIIPILAKSDC